MSSEHYSVGEQTKHVTSVHPVIEVTIHIENYVLFEVQDQEEVF
jgi:hypothetical protein